MPELKGALILPPTSDLEFDWEFSFPELKIRYPQQRKSRISFKKKRIEHLGIHRGKLFLIYFRNNVFKKLINDVLGIIIEFIGFYDYSTNTDLHWPASNDRFPDGEYHLGREEGLGWFVKIPKAGFSTKVSLKGTACHSLTRLTSGYSSTEFKFNPWSKAPPQFVIEYQLQLKRLQSTGETQFVTSTGTLVFQSKVRKWMIREGDQWNYLGKSSIRMGLKPTIIREIIWPNGFQIYEDGKLVAEWKYPQNRQLPYYSIQMAIHQWNMGSSVLLEWGNLRVWKHDYKFTIQ